MSNDSPHPLRAWREEQKLTLQAFSERLGKPEIPLSTLHYYESGLRIPKPENMERIRKTTGVTPNQFYEHRVVQCAG